MMFSFYILLLIFLSIFYFYNVDSFIKILLSMEVMGVCVIVFIFLSFDFCGFILYFLIISVCEVAIGLTLLVYFLSFYGVEYIKFSSVF